METRQSKNKQVDKAIAQTSSISHVSEVVCNISSRAAQNSQGIESSSSFVDIETNSSVRDIENKCKPSSGSKQTNSSIYLEGSNLSVSYTSTTTVSESANLSAALESVNSSVVADYDSSFEQYNAMPKRNAKTKKFWEVAAIFENKELAKEAVSDEKCWSISTTNKTTEGIKVIYRCNMAKLRGKQCESGLYLLYEANSNAVIMYKATNPHTCSTVNTRPHVPMTAEVKEIVTTFFKNGIRKRKAIQTKLASDKVPLPSKNQLYNLLRDLRLKILGTMAISIGELESVLTKYTAVPENENAPFVVNYVCNYEGDGDFKFFISTKRLLRNAVGADVWSADSTYKMTWQGFPLSPCGTIDKDRHFHLIGNLVSKDERTPDYQFMFQSVKDAAVALFNYELHPLVLICDAADAIRNAFIIVFGIHVIILMCWFHMKKAVKKNLKTLVANNKSIHEAILKDLDTLQLSQTPEIFEQASGLFLKKYKKFKRFCEYFEKEWLTANRNWYEGAKTIPAPSMNNALESWNRVTKDEKSLRHRYPLHIFFNLLLQWTLEWSEEYSSGVKVFVNTPTVDLKLWTSSYKWIRLNKVLKRQTDETTGLFYYDIAAGNEKAVQKNASSDWRNFDQYRKNAFKQWKTFISDDWRNGTCNCPAFFKQFICKHVVGIAARLKYVVVPLEAKTIPLEQKRKRGRPQKAKKALIKQ